MTSSDQTDAAAGGPLWQAYQALRAGRLSRRRFAARATALGVGAPVLAFLLRALPAAGQAATAQPTAGTSTQQRGAGGTLKLLQWQGPTTLSLQTSASFKDMLACAPVTEPLLHYLPDGTPIPCLVREVPSVENGQLAKDLTSVTYRLLPGVTWSDGQPFTADDVVFTWQWIMDPANQSTNSATYDVVANVAAVDPATVKITFKAPQIGWYVPFASGTIGGIYPKHILQGGAKAHDAFRTKPIGTGPFVVDSFSPNDQVTYSLNPKYREPTKPYFAKINLKAGGDAASAARAVLQTGDWDFAWNLQLTPDILASLSKGGKGDLVVVPGTAVEWLTLNHSDPNKVVDGQRSYWKQPHPFLSDKAVRQALNLAVDRQTISTSFYAGPPGEPPTANVLVGIPMYESKDTRWEFNLDKARQLLDQAGYTLQGGVRKKGDVELKMTYATSINQVRQDTQAVVKKAWEAIGFKVQLLEIDAGVFFDTAEGNEQNLSHMYWDVHEYAFSPASPYPLNYMLRWVSHNGRNIPQRENHWSQVNEGRYTNPEYDALYDQLAKETDPQRAAETLIKMNDILVEDVALIPMVQRASEKYGITKSLRHENIAGGPFEPLYWNIANWNRTTG